MNVVHILGNGFDLAQGLKTGYADFYDYLKTLIPSNDLERLMLKQLSSEKIILWRDLELGLGNFTENCQKDDVFSSFLFRVLESLKTYLKSQQQAFVVKEEVRTKIISDLTAPETYLKTSERNVVQAFYRTFSQPYILNILSFNYTSVLEQIIFGKNSKIDLNNGTGHWYGDRVLHIHGTLDGTMLMGVDSLDQIKNETFRKSEIIKDIMVKPISNERLGDTTDDQAKRTIMTADLITVMGMSLGETDKLWWKNIGERLQQNNNVKVILFFFMPEKDFSGNYRLMAFSEERRLKMEFLEKCEIPNDVMNSIQERIYVVMNSSYLQQK